MPKPLLELMQLGKDIEASNNNFREMISAHKKYDDNRPESNSWGDGEGDNPNPHDNEIAIEIQNFKTLNNSFDPTSTDPVSQLQELINFQEAYFIQVANGDSGLIISTPNESLADTFNKTFSSMTQTRDEELELAQWGAEYNF
jgi:hypothetical protein